MYACEFKCIIKAIRDSQFKFHSSACMLACLNPCCIEYKLGKFLWDVKGKEEGMRCFVGCQRIYGSFQKKKVTIFASLIRYCIQDQVLG